MELDPFLALDHVPVTPPPPPPAPAPVPADHGSDGVAASASSGLPPSPSRMSQETSADPLAAILDEHGPSPSSSAAPPPPSSSSPSSKDYSKKPSAASSSSSLAAPPSSISNPSPHADFQEELSTLLLQNLLPQTSITALQNLLRENATLKEKNAKLKSLLGRSAKAQRDAKNELETIKKSYENCIAEKERLEKRVEVLANRPTHMDLLADFETNFDRALLSIGGGAGDSIKKNKGRSRQSGGEDPDSGDFAYTGEDDHDDYDDDDGYYDDNNDNNDEQFQQHADLTDEDYMRQSSQYGNTTTTTNHNHKHNKRRTSHTTDSLLTTELTQAQSRITHLESLHTSLHQRYTHLEKSHSTLTNEHQHLKNTLTNLQLELRMSKMETEHALRDVRDREASLTEMQLEIDLVTASAAEANRRAAEGMEVARVARTDKEYVDGLEAKVTALQEWALASTESKRLTSERCRELEGRVRELEGERERLRGEIELMHGGFGGGGGEDGFKLMGLGTNSQDEGEEEHEGNEGQQEGGANKKLIIPSIKRTPSSKSLSSSNNNTDNERILWSKSSSLVVGAGMVGHAFLELGQVHIEPYETVILRWKFDLTPADLDIYFSVLKGICEDKRKQRGADACFRNRHVQGGGGGDVSGAFAIQNACTLVWSNEMSWVRPRTIKWTVDAVAIEWSD